MEWPAMSTEMQRASGSAAERYEALLHIAEALSACSEPEEMARALADQLDSVIHFDYLDVLAVKKNSDEVEWHAWGKGALRLPNGLIEELPIWHLYNSDERQREEIERVLEETKGRVGGAEGAAARLGIKRTTLLFRLKRLGIDPKLFS
jgi:transcriptional regulator of acetoin/glycerol metabolism